SAWGTAASRVSRRVRVARDSRATERCGNLDRRRTVADSRRTGSIRRRRVGRVAHGRDSQERLPHLRHAGRRTPRRDDAVERQPQERAMMRLAFAVALTIVTLPLAAAAQTADEITQPPPNQGPMTVERMYSGFVFAPEVKITDFDHQTSGLI